jgi:phage-related minor tail protein
MALDPNQQAQASQMMDQVLVNLNEAIGQLDYNSSNVKAAASSIGWSLLGAVGAAVDALTNPTSDARAAIQSALNTMRNIVSRLSGPARDDVMSGALAPDKWVASANEVMQGIQGLSLQLDDGTVWSNVVAACAQTLEDLKKLGKQAIPVVAGLGAVAALIIAGIFLNSWLQGGGGHSSGVAGYPSLRGSGKSKRRRRSRPRRSGRFLNEGDFDHLEGDQGELLIDDDD